jgi:nucleotide-binding universal stress UspA family protein
MQALDYAASLAQEADARLTVVHVMELPAQRGVDTHETMLAWPPSLEDYVVALDAECQARLAAAVPERVRDFCTVDTVLVTGKPYREILRVAEQRLSDLIVVGVRGRGVVDRFFFGSTAEHLVREASCPVLTIRTR